MILVNDQNPFDVTPDDDRRPAADAAQQRPEQTTDLGRTDADDATTTELSVEDDGATPIDPAIAEEDALRTRRKHRRIAALSVAAAVIFTAGAGGGAAASLALARSTTTTTSQGGTGTSGGSTSQGSTGSGTTNGFGGSTGTQGGTGTSGGNQGGFGQFGSGGQDSSGTGSSTSTDTTAATAAQITGLVTVVSELGYEDGEAAGTGIILTSGGRILTNNHVIDGATSIKVTVESTGKTYTADVVGTNATKDIAVLQLEDASGLTTATLATSEPSTGTAITAVGNANGTGTLSAATGTVSATDQTITTSSEGSTAGETLNGLLELDADVVSGDSGGAVKTSDGTVVGVTTAASSGTSDVTGYAIPITTAVSIAKQIVAGDDTAEITIGLPAFLGVSISSDTTTGTDTTGGAVIGSILSGTAAAKTALAAGDTITKIDGTTVASGAALSKVIGTHAPGDSVTVTYTDSTGASHTATVTLTEGPAD